MSAGLGSQYVGGVVVTKKDNVVKINEERSYFKALE
jgi:hypothetical protein